MIQRVGPKDQLEQIEALADMCRAKGIDRLAIRTDGSIEMVMGAPPLTLAPAATRPERRADESDEQHAARVAIEAKRAKYRRTLRREFTDEQLARLP